MSHEAEQVHSKTAGEVRNIAISFVGKLDVGEALTGVPTVTEVGSSDLTFANVGISTAVLTILGKSVAVGRAVQFRVSGGGAGKRYRIRITAASDASPSQTLIAKIVLDVTGD